MTIDPTDLFFLMRTCYGGLFRLNAAGEFNVPFHHKRPGAAPDRVAAAAADWLWQHEPRHASMARTSVSPNLFSGGYRSKFGLTVSEILRALGELKEQGMEDCFQLLHFHMGSQISNVRDIAAGMREATRYFVELSRQGAKISHVDVGGGLGIDYDGSRSAFESSMNYSMEVYARDVVANIKQICDESKVELPDIVSESGRALVAMS